jgi:hypothetical protein
MIRIFEDVFYFANLLIYPMLKYLDTADADDKLSMAEMVMVNLNINR